MFAQSTDLGMVKAILDGGVPLVLAVLVIILGYAIYIMTKHISTLQKEYREKVEELLEKQIQTQVPLTETLAKTTEALIHAEEAIEESTAVLAQVHALIEALGDEP